MIRALLPALATLVLAGSSASAHHGYATFYAPTERTVAVEGELENILYANPHVVMKIRSADSAVVTVTWQAATWVERNAGVSKETFKVGDHLVIIGSPSRDPASHDVTLVREVRRQREHWRWKSPAPFAPPS